MFRENFLYKGHRADAKLLTHRTCLRYPIPRPLPSVKGLTSVYDRKLYLIIEVLFLYGGEDFGAVEE